MSGLNEQIVARIRNEGPIPFALFMSLALYDPQHGYYATGKQRTGWAGDFVTSPEIDAGFGTLWARAFERVWTECGRPQDFELVEIGPGEGGFAEAVLTAVREPFASALVYRLVERVDEVHARQLQRLSHHGRVTRSTSVTELPEVAAGCIFANEVLDNLPVHVLEATGDGFAEVMVGEQDGRLTWVLGPPSNQELVAFVQRTGTDPATGSRVEITLAAESLINHVSRRLGCGAMYLVDYGAEGAELAARGGSLLSYSTRGISEDVLSDPGDRDITAHANWTSARRTFERQGFVVEGPHSQRDVLLSLGARDLDRTLKEEHDASLAGGDGRSAVSALSRRQALRALLDEGGLGGLEVLAAYRGISPTIDPERAETGP